MDLTANGNIHHEEEAWPNFCCSLLLLRSLRSSVYIQEGQGVNHGYLLLGVYDRRTPSATDTDTDTFGFKQADKIGQYNTIIRTQSQKKVRLT